MRNEKPHYMINAQKLNSLSPAERGDVLFGDRYTLLGNISEYKRQFPEQYSEAKIASGKVGPNIYERAKAQFDSLQPPMLRFDAEVQRVRQAISEDEAREAFSNQGPQSPYNLKALDKSDPLRAYELRLAMHSYGLLTRRPSKPVIQHLPRGSHATATEYLNIVADYVERERKKAEENGPQ